MEVNSRFSEDMQPQALKAAHSYETYRSHPSASAQEEALRDHAYQSDPLQPQLAISRKPVSPPPQNPTFLQDHIDKDRKQSVPRKPLSSQPLPPQALSSELEVVEGTQEYPTEKSRPQSPSSLQQHEIASIGLESVWSREADKEVYRGNQYHPAGTYPPNNDIAQASNDGDRRMKKRICGLPWQWALFVAGLVVCVIAGAAVALGVTFGTKHSTKPTPAGTTSVAPPPVTTSATSSTTASPTPTGPPANSGDPNYDIGGALNPSYYSNNGAFNGSGIALASQSFGQGTYGSINLYFQHHTGSIRYTRLMEDGTWQGGSVSETIADDAKNGTPIAAVAYALNDTSTWHIFYIDTNNTVKQKLNTNLTNVWVDGPLNALNVVANSRPSVGLQACWFGNFYGDADYTHSPEYNAPNISTTVGADSTVGIHMYVGNSDTSFKQYSWLHGENDWTFQDTWYNKNAQAGVGCYSWGPGTVSYVFMLDLNNNLEIWWKDTNSSLRTNSTHPINVWTNSSISVLGLHPSSSLGYTNYLYAQLADNSIHGYNITFDAENTAFVPGDQFRISGDLGVPGTHLSVTTLPNLSGGNNLLAFYQTDGDDITEYSRDMQAGQWTGGAVPIPNS